MLKLGTMIIALLAPKPKALARNNKAGMGCSGSKSLLIAWRWKCRRRQSDHTPLCASPASCSWPTTTTAANWQPPPPRSPWRTTIDRRSRIHSQQTACPPFTAS